MSEWLKRNRGTAGIAIGIFVGALTNYIVFDRRPSADDHAPSTALVCRGEVNDYSHCAPATMSFPSHAACARLVGAITFGVHSVKTIIPNADGRELPVTVSCVPAEGLQQVPPGSRTST